MQCNLFHPRFSNSETMSLLARTCLLSRRGRKSLAAAGSPGEDVNACPPISTQTQPANPCSARQGGSEQGPGPAPTPTPLGALEQGTWPLTLLQRSGVSSLYGARSTPAMDCSA